MVERDNLFRRHPKTRFVTAHLGWHANDLARLGRLLDEMPNLYTEVGAVLAELGRQPRMAHDFFVKYQGPDPVREGRVPARGVPLLLARLRDR